MNRPSLAVAGLTCVFTFAPFVAAAAVTDWAPAEVRVERVREPVFGGKIALYRAGKEGAPPVVLVHGLGPDGAVAWREVAHALSGTHDVYAPDLPGFGASDGGNHLYSPDRMADALHASVAARIRGPFTLVGHSNGAAVALAYAHAYPQSVDRLILMDMAGVLHRSVFAGFLSRLGAEQVTGVDLGHLPWFDNVVRSVLSRVERLPFDTRTLLDSVLLRQRIFREDANAIAAFALVEHDFGDALRSLDLPVLLVWGADDRVAPLRTGQAAASLIPGARLVVIEGAGHTPQLEAPDRLIAVLRAELTGGLRVGPWRFEAKPVTAQVAAVCEDQRDWRREGEFRQVVLKNCPGAVLERARIGELVVTGGSLELLNSHVAGGIDAYDTRIRITGGSVAGDPPLRLERAAVDAAGTHFRPKRHLVLNRGEAEVTLHFSVCDVEVSTEVEDVSGGLLHDLVRVPASAGY